jgi:hypothetical protein
MILMSVIEPMGQYEIGLESRFQGFDPVLDVFPLAREKTVLKLGQLHLCACRSGKKSLSGAARLAGPIAGCAKHAPMNMELSS